MTNDNVFETLSKIRLKVEKKGRFNYASWVEAWSAVKKHYPEANYRVIPYIVEKFKDDMVVKTEKLVHPISSEGGGFVKVSVKIGELEHEECFPILNNYNKHIKYDFINAFDVNTSIKRALVKCLAQFGLGLYVYAGEDLPSQNGNE